MSKILNFEKFITLNEAQAPMKPITTKTGKDVSIVRTGKEDEYTQESGKFYIGLSPDNKEVSFDLDANKYFFSGLNFAPQGFFTGKKDPDVKGESIASDAYGILYRIAFLLNGSKAPTQDSFEDVLKIINELSKIPDFKKIALENTNFAKFRNALIANAQDPSKAVIFSPAKADQNLKLISAALKSVPLVA
jgi:hypothetical protein